MKIIFYKGQNLGSEITETLVQRFAESMKADVLTIENEKNVPTPSVIVQDNYNNEIFRSSDLEAIKRLLQIQVTNLTPQKVKKVAIVGSIGVILAGIGIYFYNKKQSQQVCECE